MKRKSALFLFLVLSTVVSGLAQDATSLKVDEFIAAEMQKQKIPGVSLAVVKDGKPLILKGYGLANVEHRAPVKPETIFQSGSVGKQFTAAAVMLLSEEGRIVLDEKIGKYLSDSPEALKNITVRQLLTHTNGLASYPEDFDFRRDYTEDELWTRIKEVRPMFQPGTRWRYSNLGYVILGILISKVTGKFYGDFLQERIFRPLGMTTARVITEADIVLNRSAGYRLVHGEVKNQEWVSPSINTTADGSLYLSVPDMIKWDAAWNTDKLLKEESRRMSWAPVNLVDGTTHPYGFGWEVNSVNGRRVIEHGGTWQGFESHLSKYPDESVSVMIFANLRGARVRTMAHEIAAIVNAELRARPTADNDVATTKRHRRLLQEMIDGTADRGLFTQEGAQSIFPLVEKARDQMKTLGVIDGIELLERKTDVRSQSNIYRVVFSNARAIYTVVLTDGKIANMDLKPE